MSRLAIIFVTLGVVCSASSCNVWRRVTGKQKGIPTADSIVLAKDSVTIVPDTLLAKVDTTNVFPLVPDDTQKLALIQSFLPLWNAQTAYTTFSGKAKVGYEGKGESHDFTAIIRMEKDKRIWVSITALGLFEAARALITPDTIIAINRLKKEVHILPFRDAGKLLPISADFATLQNLIIGDVLHTGMSPTEVADTGVAILLSTIMQDFSQQVSFSKSDTTINAQTLSGSGSILQSIYYNYITTDGRHFANNRDLTMSDKGEKHIINLEFSKAEFDQAVDMSFTIPTKYDRK